jgi:hypothetical protein
VADVDFFFDFISPYTYLARTHRRAVQDVADAHSQSDEDCGQYSHNRGLEQQAEVRGRASEDGALGIKFP